MAVPAVLQSLLVRQSMAFATAWEARYPHDWLIWEPGAWKVPAQAERMADTQLGASDPADRPVKGDGLCFELRPAYGKLKLGRAPENDIVINDATVSREHLILERKGAQWQVHGLPNTKATTLRGAALAPSDALPLQSGDRITVGGVAFTYLTAAGLKSRVTAEAQKLHR